MSTKTTDNNHNGNIAVLTRKNCCQAFFVYAGARGRMEGMGPMEFLQKGGISDRNIVFIRDPNVNFFHEGVSEEAPNLDAVIDWHRDFLAENPHITETYAVGNSFGGWAAMFFGYMLGMTRVWAMAPAGPWGRDLLVDLMADPNGATTYEIYYSGQIDADREFAEALVDTPDVELVQLDEHGHLMVSGLIQNGQLPTLFPPFRDAEGNTTAA